MNIERMRGDTYADSFVVTNVATGEVANVTGCTAYLTLSAVPNPSDTSQQLYQIVGELSDPVNGIIDFSPTDIQANNVGVYFYDIELIDSNGVVRTLAKGSYTYKQDITKN